MYLPRHLESSRAEPQRIPSEQKHINPNCLILNIKNPEDILSKLDTGL